MCRHPSSSPPYVFFYRKVSFITYKMNKHVTYIHTGYLMSVQQKTGLQQTLSKEQSEEHLLRYFMLGHVPKNHQCPKRERLKSQLMYFLTVIPGEQGAYEEKRQTTLVILCMCVCLSLSLTHTDTSTCTHPHTHMHAHQQSMQDCADESYRTICPGHSHHHSLPSSI